MNSVTTPIHFAIVGAGVIAPLHARAIAQQKDAKLVAVCDIIEDRAAKLASEYDAPGVYTNCKTMLREQPEIDIVSVCVPSGTHAEITIAAAEAKKHVLCEKPLEITAAKMDAMLEACAKNQVKLAGVFQRRTMEAAKITKQAIDDGKLGRMVLGDAYLKYYRSPEYYKSAGWRGTWELDGGGALMNQGIHGIDLIQWMMGEVESVFAYASPLVRDIEVEDTAVVALKYKNGAFGVIQGTTSVYPGMPTRFQLHGENGTIAFSDLGIEQWAFQDSDEEVPETRADIGGSSDPKAISEDGHFLLVDDFVRAVQEDRDPLVGGADARKAVDLLLAIYESARTGKEVQVP